MSIQRVDGARGKQAGQGVVPARTLVIGTRGSRLAVRQTEITLQILRPLSWKAQFKMETIRTEGDQSPASLSEIGGRGVFAIELERALLDGKIDVAVHSLKDLPSDETPGLKIAAVLKREDPRDVLVSRERISLAHLPEGAVIGTCSPRRAVQITALRQDLQVKDIRGNVETRIRKVDEGEYDAVILAAAGLLRLGIIARAAHSFTMEEVLPAVAQGAIAVQVRADDEEAVSLVRVADHLATRAAVTAERAFERRLGGGCHAAIAAHAIYSPPSGPHGEESWAYIHMRGLVGSSDGTLIRAEARGRAEAGEAIGAYLAQQLIDRGAGAMLETRS